MCVAWSAQAGQQSCYSSSGVAQTFLLFVASPRLFRGKVFAFPKRRPTVAFFSGRRVNKNVREFTRIFRKGSLDYLHLSATKRLFNTIYVILQVGKLDSIWYHFISLQFWFWKNVQCNFYTVSIHRCINATCKSTFLFLLDFVSCIYAMQTTKT